MDWTELRFGKRKGETLPEIAFYDPYYLMWLLEEANLVDRLAFEARRIKRRISRIVLKTRKYGSYEFVWDIDRWGYHGVRVARRVKPEDRQPHDGERTQFLDLAMLKSRGRFSKRDYELFCADIRKILFGDANHKMTRSRCEAFFNNPRNFG